MKTQLYLEGYLSSKKSSSILCPVSSSVLLFVLRYCQSEDFQVIFTQRNKIKSEQEVSENEETSCIELEKEQHLKTLDYCVQEWGSIPKEVQNVNLPSLHQKSLSLVRCGLCVVIRHIIKESDKAKPDLHLIDLLGFRQGSMRMCAEVSGWTKLCEVDLAASVTNVINQIQKLSHTEKERDHMEQQLDLTLPTDLMTLEDHFVKKCRIHNDDKKKRAELIRLKTYFSLLHDSKAKTQGPASAQEETNQSKEAKEQDITTSYFSKLSILDVPNAPTNLNLELLKLKLSKSQLFIEANVQLHHGIRRITVKKNLEAQRESTNSDQIESTEAVIPAIVSLVYTSKCLSSGVKLETSIAPPYETGRYESVEELSLEDMTAITHAVELLTYMDIDYAHVYSEGVELTIADLILLVYLYHLMESMKFDCQSLLCHLPNIAQWACHMTSLASVKETYGKMAWSVNDQRAVLMKDISLEKSSQISFVTQPREEEAKEEVELNRCAKMKHKAIKPEVIQALGKLEASSISPIIGSHPFGENVQVDWEKLPSGVHPKEGDVPEKRTQRKCQQLENLVTAVQAIAKPGDIIIDFCSGGGHLGIVIAYLLPECKVYLVENKEESLLKACSRLESLNLQNVTLYQCNIDYFVGQFQVGVCLHACGSATDMVLQLCLNSHAGFVICPCCYGSIQKTHLLSYPRSNLFLQTSLTYKDFLTLGHAADQTEFNIKLEGQGRQCMNLVDTDRAQYAQQWGYDVTLCSLQPLSCTPKNNLLIGKPK